MDDKLLVFRELPLLSPFFSQFLSDLPSPFICTHYPAQCLFLLIDRWRRWSSNAFQSFFHLTFFLTSTPRRRRGNGEKSRRGSPAATKFENKWAIDRVKTGKSEEGTCGSGCRESAIWERIAEKRQDETKTAPEASAAGKTRPSGWICESSKSVGGTRVRCD